MPCRTTSAGNATACRSTPCTRAFDCGRRPRIPAGSSRARTRAPSHECGHPRLRDPSARRRLAWSGRGGVDAAVLCEKRLEARPDVFLALDEHRLKVLGFEAAEDVEHGTFVVA